MDININLLVVAVLSVASLQGIFAQATAELPNSVDHVGILQSLGDQEFEEGRTIYMNLCTNCHGSDGINPPLPTARAFGEGELKFGSDPYAMFLTLTNGNGLMGPQTWMTPEERYAVIHYIRETFMRPMRDDFNEIDNGYLENLPTVNVSISEDEKMERNFGPALASQLGREKSSVLSIKLGPETTISYDLHTMDQAGIWKGGFLDLKNTQHYRERGGGVPMPEGETLEGLDVWRWGHQGTLAYPRDHLLPRGPMPTEWMDYRGHYLHGDKVVLSYAIDEREILELPDASGRFPAVQHTLRVGPGKKLVLAVGSVADSKSDFSGKLRADSVKLELGKDGDLAVLGSAFNDSDNDLGKFVSAAVSGDADGLIWTWNDEDQLVLEIPEDAQERLIQVVRYAGTGESNLFSFANFIRSKKLGREVPRDPGSFLAGAGLQWPKILKTKGELGDPSRAYTMDTIGLPPDDGGNPYNVWFRTSALAFFEDGRMVVTTHGGDVWIVDGVDANLENLRWKRFAAGLYEPFGVLVIDGLVYVTCKDRLTRLHDFNGDGEADFYESFSADDDVSTFFHAFNFDLQRDSDGNLYYAKAGMYTDYREAGSIIKISPDGKTREIYCTGFRTPNGMGMMPDGRPTVSDNQGTWMPASKISICAPGGAESERPNILIIYTDDQGYGDVSALNPHSKIQTPHMDRLIREGINFTHGHSAGSACTPSRYALMTGRYPWRTKLKTGVSQAGDPSVIAEDRLTIGKMLQQQGYHTACIGKWHMGMVFPGERGNRDWSQPIEQGPLDRGFDYWYGIPTSPKIVCAWFENRGLAPGAAEPTLLTYHKKNLPHIGPRWRIMQPFYTDLDQQPKETIQNSRFITEVAPDWEDDQLLTRYTDKAIEWIGEMAADVKNGKPFFLYFSMTSPHEPVARQTNDTGWWSAVNWMTPEAYRSKNLK